MIYAHGTSRFNRSLTREFAAPAGAQVQLVLHNSLPAHRVVSLVKHCLAGCASPRAMEGVRGSWNENKQEIYTIVRLSIPVSTGFLLNKLVSFVSVIFVGHLGPAELAAAALGSSLINVVGNSVLAGLAGAMSTLCGQVMFYNASAAVATACTLSQLTAFCTAFLEKYRHDQNTMSVSYPICALLYCCLPCSGVWSQKL